jgi:O-glycosyl hydrolase
MAVVQVMTTGRIARTVAASFTVTLLACSADSATGVDTFSNPGTCAASPSVLPATDVTVTVDAAQRFQTIQGFGATQRLFDDPHVTETFDARTGRAAATAVPPASDQAKILDALYVSLGLTRVRIHPEGLEPVNDNADPNTPDLSKFSFGNRGADGHIAAVKSLLPRGVTTYFASPVVIETWMNESNPDEYVEWVMVMLRHWRQQGLDMPYYSILNEPGYYVGGRQWSGEWMRDVAKKLGPRLAAESFPTKLVVSEDDSPSSAYGRIQTVLADPDARKYIGAIAYHLYARGGEDRIAQLGKQYGIPVWMTEFSTPDDWRAWATVMQQLLADDEVSAIDYMWGYFGDWDRSQLIRLKLSGTSYFGFDMTKQYYVMGQYSRFVRPGAVRIAATSSDPDVKVVAFMDGAKPIVVVTNLGPRDHTVRFELGSAGVCGGKLQAARTSESDSWSALPEVTLDQPRFAAPASAGSVTTFAGR